MLKVANTEKNQSSLQLYESKKNESLRVSSESTPQTQTFQITSEEMTANFVAI